MMLKKFAMLSMLTAMVASLSFANDSCKDEACAPSTLCTTGTEETLEEGVVATCDGALACGDGESDVTFTITEENKDEALVAADESTLLAKCCPCDDENRQV